MKRIEEAKKRVELQQKKKQRDLLFSPKTLKEKLIQKKLQKLCHKEYPESKPTELSLQRNITTCENLKNIQINQFSTPHKNFERKTSFQESIQNGQHNFDDKSLQNLDEDYLYLNQKKKTLQRSFSIQTSTKSLSNMLKFNNDYQDDDFSSIQQVQIGFADFPKDNIGIKNKQNFRLKQYKRIDYFTPKSQKINSFQDQISCDRLTQKNNDNLPMNCKTRQQKIDLLEKQDQQPD